MRQRITSFLLFLFCLSGFFSCSSSSGDDKTYETARTTLTEQELASPGRFIRIEVDKQKRNLVGKTVVKFRLVNTATTVSYTDVRIRSLFYQDGKLVANHEDVYDDKLEPGDDEEESIRYRTPRGTDDVKLEFMSAKAELHKK